MTRFPYICLTFAAVVVACETDDDGPCSGALEDGGIVGTTLDANCDEGDEPCFAAAELSVFDVDPNAVTDQEPLAMHHSTGEFAFELGPGTYYLCKFLGDTAFECADPITLDETNPFARLSHTWDGADSFWSNEGC